MGKHFDHVGRALSLVIFIAGVGLLALVFAVAYHMLTNPVPGLSAALGATAGKGASTGQQPLVGGAAAVLSFLLRLAVLFVMTLAASLIAARGIHLYFAAIGAGHTGASAEPAGNHANGTKLDTETRRSESNGAQASAGAQSSASAQSAAAPAVSSGSRAPREGSSKREGEGGASAGDASGSRQ